MAQPGKMEQPIGISPVIVQTQPYFGDVPVQTQCRVCGHNILTTVSKENGACAYVMCFVVFLFFCPCFWVPLVMDSCKDVHHLCPSCGTELGMKKPM